VVAVTVGGMTTCEAADCDRESYARGHCSRHDKQLLRHGAVRPELPAPSCAIPGCGRRAVTRGWCHGHYLRWSRTGDVRPDVPLARPEQDDCSVDGCTRGAHSAGLCRSHDRRRRLYGDPLAGGDVRRSGDRLDNRPQNLELWTTAQPKGQHVEDKIAYALEILERYDHEARAALGLDLDPETGLPYAESLPSRWEGRLSDPAT
jgi:hypothetical protein